jgi:hypothetical protein
LSTPYITTKNSTDVVVPANAEIASGGSCQIELQVKDFIAKSVQIIRGAVVEAALSKSAIPPKIRRVKMMAD